MSEAAGEEVVPGALKYLGPEGHDQELRSPAGSTPSGGNWRKFFGFQFFHLKMRLL